MLWLAWGWVLFSIDPFATNFVGFLLFYLTFFLSFTGTVAILGFFFRKVRLNEHPNFHLVAISFRQSLIISVLFTSLLVLQGLGWLTLWLVLIFFLIAIIIETIILARQKRSTPEISFTVTQVQEYMYTDPEFIKRSIE